MRNQYYAVTTPTNVVQDLETAQKFVAEKNANILLGGDFPASLDFLDIQDIVGDPNYAFSDDVASALAEVGVLTRTQLRTKKGVPVTLGEEKAPVWTYDWGTQTFAACTHAQLLAVGWDLRTHPMFSNVHRVSGMAE